MGGRGRGQDGGQQGSASQQEGEMLLHALSWLWGKRLVAGCLASEQSSERADSGQGFDGHSAGVGIGLTGLAGLCGAQRGT